MKEQKRISLSGKNATSVGILEFSNPEKGVEVIIDTHKGCAKMSTKKGSYELSKHPTLNIYQLKIGGVKVHITHKAWVAQVIYWA